MKRTMNRKLHFPTLSEWKNKPGYEGTYKAIPKNWITKFETKFAESELKQLIRNINWKPMKETKSGHKKVRLFNEKKKKIERFESESFQLIFNSFGWKPPNSLTVASF